MGRTSRRHSYRKSRRWNPGVIGPKNASDRKLIRICTQGGSLSDAYALIRSGKCSADVAKEASKALGMVIKQLPGFARKAIKTATRSKSRKGRSSKRRSTKSRKSRKSTKRRSTKSRRSTKARKGKSSRSTWVAKQKRGERKARRKARYYQGKHRAKTRRGGNSKSALNRALYAARGGRFASRNPRRSSRGRRW